MREGSCSRKTSETDVFVRINIDGSGEYSVETGIPIFDHFLELFAKHGLFDLEVRAKGDVEVDAHHTVEDVGICLGKAFAEALGEKVGITRYGRGDVPMGEALAWVTVDIAGRPFLREHRTVHTPPTGGMDASLLAEFLRAFANNALVEIHYSLESGENTHHVLEAAFKALALALDEATRFDPRRKDVPSTKGRL